MKLYMSLRQTEMPNLAVAKTGFTTATACRIE
jgi:hypothetical protein